MFCSLQSERGQAILKYLGRETDRFDTFIFIENGEAFTGSTGVLKEIRYLAGGWRYLSIFRFIPRPIRDFFYNIVAQNRYRLFGKKNECWMPTPELKARFW